MGWKTEDIRLAGKVELIHNIFNMEKQIIAKIGKTRINL